MTPIKMFPPSAVDLQAIHEVFVNFTLSATTTRIFQRELLVFDKDRSENDHVAKITLQVDKTFKRRLTIQQIEVHPEFQRKGIARKIIKCLKTSCVALQRVAHVESVVDNVMTKLLYSEHFYPTDGGFCYIWEPLNVQTWALDTSQFQNHFYMHDKTIEESALQLVETWKNCIPGMELFSTRSKWFEPETDLKKIAAELGIPEIALKDFRKDKACFGISSFFTEVYPEYYVIEGLAVDPQLGPIALEHACLCSITKGKVYAFDLVRRSQLFMYGVVVRPDMKKRMNDVCKDTWAGYSIIQGLNYIKSDESFWD